MEEIFCTNNQELQIAQLEAIASAAEELSKTKKSAPVRLLDLATGPNGLNLSIVRQLISRKISYELVLSDISPTHFKIGYDALKRGLSPAELTKVKCVLADSRDLRRELEEVPIWGEGVKKLEEVLKDPRNSFLQTGHSGKKRVENFSEGSFDLVIGVIPYGSINTEDYADAIRESERILVRGGYHIVDEMQVERINLEIPRTEAAKDRAKVRLIDLIRSKLDSSLAPVAVYSAIYTYRTLERNPEQTVQDGDLIKRSVVVHTKRKGLF
jgi:hypothetical protein